MKHKFFIIALAVLALMGCEYDRGQYMKFVVASKQSYIIGEHGLPEVRYIMRNADNGGEWKQYILLNATLLDYTPGYEYTIEAYEAPYKPDEFPEYKDVLWWTVDSVLDRVEADSDISNDMYIYTYGSPWGFDPRDPALEYMLEHYKEIFGEEYDIFYPSLESTPMH